jgi:hypothetical protein
VSFVKEGESWRIARDKVIKDILHRADFVRLLKFPRPRWYGHVERMKNQRMSKNCNSYSGRNNEKWKTT